MARKKNYYYVLVMTNNGPVFVTGVPSRNWAEYNREEAPKAFESKEYALDIANGLTLNFQIAYMVTLCYELESQPYRYSEGKFEWKWNNKEDEN